MVIVGVIGFGVDAETHRHVGVRSGCRDQHLLGAGLEMLLGVDPGAEKTRRLDDDVDTHVSPGKIGGISLGKHRYVFTVDNERVVADLDRSLEGAVDRIVFQQVSERGGVGEVVERDDLDVGIVTNRSSQGVATDASEAVNGYAGGHSNLLLENGSRASRQEARARPPNVPQTPIGHASRGSRDPQKAPLTRHYPGTVLNLSTRRPSSA